jgi:hypothetical protein
MPPPRKPEFEFSPEERPGDKVRGTKLEVRIAKPEKAGTHRVVQRWNQSIKEMVCLQ